MFFLPLPLPGNLHAQMNADGKILEAAGTRQEGDKKVTRRLNPKDVYIGGDLDVSGGAKIGRARQYGNRYTPPEINKPVITYDTARYPFESRW